MKSNEHFFLFTYESFMFLLLELIASFRLGLQLLVGLVVTAEVPVATVALGEMLLAHIAGLAFLVELSIASSIGLTVRVAPASSLVVPNL
jgi:hypothetical protein